MQVPVAQCASASTEHECRLCRYPACCVRACAWCVRACARASTCTVLRLASVRRARRKGSRVHGDFTRVGGPVTPVSCMRACAWCVHACAWCVRACVWCVRACACASTCAVLWLASVRKGSRVHAFTATSRGWVGRLRRYPACVRVRVRVRVRVSCLCV
jgi:hypothetical protein